MNSDNCRHVHLDFHTSPIIKGIGSKFDKKQFQSALKEGNLTSITVFAKCHHGLCYYPTETGTMHPGLDFDLTGAMVEAAHEIGVKAPIYITAGWSETDANAHPEWLSRDCDGSVRTNNGKYDFDHSDSDALPFCTWRNLCLNDGEYCRHIYTQTEEICKRYKTVDGLFYDICFLGDYCLCDECRSGMKASGLNPDSLDDAKQYYRSKHIDFMKKCGEILHKYHPNASIFFNSGGAEIGKPEYHPYETHYEMEDLPTAWGGYDKMALNASFFSQLGKPFLGMTGKFHLDWGEFGGFKCKEALKYEVATMAVYGAACSIGDHMFPDGEQDMQTYKNIGYAYRYYESLEPYIFGESTADIGLYLSTDEAANSGISKILTESQIDYSIVLNGNFKRFDTVIFPEICNLSDGDREKLKAYVADGGKVLFCNGALIENGEFVLDCGLCEPTLSKDDCAYIVPTVGFSVEVPRSPCLSYEAGTVTRPNGATVIAEMLAPRFNRTYGHFCGHKNTPYDKQGERYPAVSQKGNIVYSALPLPRLYHKYGSIYYKRYILEALRLLKPQLKLRTDIYSQGRCRMIKQSEKNRYCINMTYAAPVKRGCAEIIEDIVPIYDIPFTVAVEETVKSIYLPLKDTYLDFSTEDGAVRFTLPKLNCHETVVLNY